MTQHVNICHTFNVLLCRGGQEKTKNRTISTSIIFSTSCFVGGGVASLKKLNRTYVNFDHTRTVSVGEMEGNVNMTQHDIFRIQNAWFFVGQGGGS